MEPLESAVQTMLRRLDQMRGAKSSITFDGEVKYEIPQPWVCPSTKQNILPETITHSGTFKIYKSWSSGVSLSIRLQGLKLGNTSSAFIDIESKWQASDDQKQIYASYRHASWPRDTFGKVYIRPESIRS